MKISLLADPRNWLDDDFLIDPNYAIDRGWTLVCIEDSLSREQLDKLINHGQDDPTLKVAYIRDMKMHVEKIPPPADRISEKLFLLSGGFACLWDDPESFVLSAWYSDVTWIATSLDRIFDMFGYDFDKNQEWNDVISDMRPDLLEKICRKYDNQK